MERLDELRCTRCHHLLAKIRLAATLERFGVIQIKCDKCKQMNTFDHLPEPYVKKADTPTPNLFE